MRLDDLADAARSSGLSVWESPGWKSRRHGEMSAVRGVICHHTGSSGSGAWTVVRDGRSDLAGPLAQLTLERDGSVRVLADGQAWHAGAGSWPSIGRNNGNAYCIGIEAVYNGSDITAAQRAAYPRLVAALCRHYGVPVGNVIGHKEWAPTRKVDPGQIDMAAFRRDVAALIARPSTPTTQEDDDMTPEQDQRLARLERGLDTVVKQLCGETATLDNPWPGEAKGGGWPRKDIAVTAARLTPVMFLQGLDAAVRRIEAALSRLTEGK